MSIIINCRLHPKYKAIHPPRFTTKHPYGCPGCMIMWRATYGNGPLLFVERP